MTEDEIVDFFNRQDALPDTIRTEHYRTFLAAMHAPALDRFRACLHAAWSSRREVAAPPRSDFLVKRTTTIKTALEKASRTRNGIHGDIDALRTLLRRQRLGKSGLPDGDNMAGRVLLAGMYARIGFLADAEKTLQTLYHELRERFLHPDQDPLWSATSQRASRTHRLTELEIMRTNAENEVFVRTEMVRRERELLTAAAECIRDAFREGILDGDAETALYYAYMMGECLRRVGDLPLASEWFENLLSLAPAESPWALAATLQLEYVDEEAGGKVNLLSALGRDGELFARLRRICQGGPQGLSGGDTQ